MEGYILVGRLACTTDMAMTESPVTLVLACLLDSIVYFTLQANFHNASTAFAPMPDLWRISRGNPLSRGQPEPCAQLANHFVGGQRSLWLLSATHSLLSSQASFQCSSFAC